MATNSMRMFGISRHENWPNSGLAVALLSGGLLLINPSTARSQSCTQTLNPGANVGSAVSGAAAGSTICLNSGSYGSIVLSGIVKNPRVTIRSVTGQGATMDLTIQSGTNGITVQSVTLSGAAMTGSTTRNITIESSKFLGHLRIDGLANSNVLLDRNTHNNIEGGGQFSAPARIHLSYSSSTHSGVTVQNSLMDGGSADGVQTGVGVNIIGNEMRNITEGACADCHTDAIQLLGAPNSVIRGNYIHNVSTGIVAFDGVVRATIENNVVLTAGRPWGIELYSDQDSIIRHNTVVYRANCDYNLPCGTIALDRKSVDPAGTGTIVVDNIATSINAVNGSTYAERHHNLVRVSAAIGDIAGSPTYVGGANPTTWNGFQLTTGSLGKGAASSPPGTNIGSLSFGPTSAAPAVPTGLRVVL